MTQGLESLIARHVFKVVGLALVLLVYVPAHAAGATIDFVGVFNGVTSTGGVLPAGSVDPNYVLIQLPSGCTPITCPEAPNDIFGPSTYVLGPNGTSPIDGTTWGLNDANSQWIGPSVFTSDPLASDTEAYVYRTVFNLTAMGLDPATFDIQILLAWASDSGVNSAIRLCGIAAILDPVCGVGTTVTGSSNGGPLGLTAVSLVDGVNNAFFNAGLNALDFIFYNSIVPGGGVNPSGLRVDIVSATASDIPITPPVPEPGTMGLLALGLATCIAGLRRRAKQSV